ncbi:zinc-binding protein A33-like [Carcharodon carcharias]|uniref:zinc-binding protein A33-like n=1 Tax=Carcharodon carcharias TaxID=13397 RepID=UPI001B7F215B|nr:zinc-binding protein A33-like [Carcharodon carcharias]
MASADLTYELTCPICLETFTDPVSLECEHHFCRSCISQSWDKVPGDVSCPQCRQVFTQRNIRTARTLGNIVEKFRLLKVKVTQPEEVFYCQEHEEKLKLFCEEEQKAICVDCWSSGHQTHKDLHIKEAVQKYKNKLEKSLEFLQKQMDLSLQSKREGEEGILQMKAQVDSLRNEIKSEFEKMHKFLFGKEELMKAELERKSNKILEEMGNNLKRTLEEMSALEGTIIDLKSRLQIQEAPELLKDIQVLLKRSQMEFHNPGAASSQLPVDIVDEPFKYINVWREMRAVISPVPESLTLDPETANNLLSISQDLTSVSLRNEEQNLPDQLQRFDCCLCVLSSQSFTSGKNYWEVGLGKKSEWVVGICRESINRKGNITLSPDNGFWVFAQLSDCKSLKIPDVISQLKVKPRKLGVYLDYEGGRVSFYDVEDMSHLHTFTDTFTEKLYPIFNPCKTDTADDTDPLRLLTS